MDLLMSGRNNWIFQRLPIESGNKHRFDAAIGTGIHGHGALAGSFEAFMRVAIPEAQDSEARAIAKLGMFPGFHDPFHQCCRGRADDAALFEVTDRAPPGHDAASSWTFAPTMGVGVPKKATPRVAGSAGGGRAGSG